MKCKQTFEGLFNLIDTLTAGYNKGGYLGCGTGGKRGVIMKQRSTVRCLNRSLNNSQNKFALKIRTRLKSKTLL